MQKGRTPIDALKEWQKQRPDLFSAQIDKEEINPILSIATKAA